MAQYQQAPMNYGSQPSMDYQQPVTNYSSQHSMTHEHQQQPAIAPSPLVHEHVTEKPRGGHAFGNKWANSFWDCCSPFDLCFMSCCCPCLVFGKTQSRIKDPQNVSSCNSMCFAWYGLTCFGAQGILQWLKRGDMREKYRIEGSSFGDFCGACCCPCCGLMQEEKESLLRDTGIDAKTGQQYQAPSGMSYP